MEHHFKEISDRLSSVESELMQVLRKNIGLNAQETTELTGEIDNLASLLNSGPPAPSLSATSHKARRPYAE